MKVLVGTRCLIQPKTGIGHYTQELLQALGQLADSPEISSFPASPLLRLTQLGLCASKSLNHWAKIFAKTKTKGNGDRLGSGGQPAWLEKIYNHLLARELASGKYDLYHEPNYFAHPTDLPTIVTVCDLSALLHPDWHPAVRVRRHEELFKWLLPSGAHFLTISELVKNDMVQVLGVSPQRIHVTCCGVRDHFRPMPTEAIDAGLKRLGLPRGYFLHVGTIEPRKNLILLLKAWANLEPQWKSKHPLVLVGGNWLGGLQNLGFDSPTQIARFDPPRLPCRKGFTGGLQRGQGLCLSLALRRFWHAPGGNVGLRGSRIDRPGRSRGRGYQPLRPYHTVQRCCRLARCHDLGCFR